MRTAVVTGATKGIGREVAKRLAASGHRTIALGRTVIENELPGVDFMACDVTQEQSVQRVFDEIGAVDILVNNAGVSTSNPLHKTTKNQWDSNLAVNATGPFLCSRAVVVGMRDRGFGRIVTVASTASLEGSPYIAAYAASKHAVIGLMRVIAAEVAGSGVTANSVCPTFVRTEMTVATIANIAKATSSSLAAAETRLAESTPHGRILEVGEVAQAVIDLINTTSNGQEVLLDGGTK